MKTAILIHGTAYDDEYFSDAYPSLSNSHWFPWLQKQLIIKGYAAQTPEIPQANRPQYPLWKAELERYGIGPETLLAGHSCGGGFLLRWLSENPVPVRRVALVAPWLDPDRSKTDDFFAFRIDPDLTARTELHLLHSDNDTGDIQRSVAAIRQALPAVHFHAFPGHGHFCSADMGTDAFPALLRILTD